jgi:hypothetical protein
MGEMVGFCTSLARTARSASDLPRRASWSLVNLAFARLCCGVWACGRGRGRVLALCRRGQERRGETRAGGKWRVVVGMGERASSLELGARPGSNHGLGRRVGCAGIGGRAGRGCRGELDGSCLHARALWATACRGDGALGNVPLCRLCIEANRTGI